MNVLFLCPHGAAKSVVAAALFMRESTQVGRSQVAARRGGTDPDDEVSPTAVDLLDGLGLASGGPPRLVTALDINWADVVVSLGCRLDELPDQPRRWVDWSDAPAVSEDAPGFVDLVSARIADLLE